MKEKKKYGEGGKYPQVPAGTRKQAYYPVSFRGKPKNPFSHFPILPKVRLAIGVVVLGSPTGIRRLVDYGMFAFNHIAGRRELATLPQLAFRQVRRKSDTD